MDKLSDAMRRQGWKVIGQGYYRKGDWAVDLDTSSWMIVSTARNPRVFDVHVPSDYEASWTANLIEHLCAIDDERFRLRDALVTLRDSPDAQQIVSSSLQECYHNWLVNTAVPERQVGYEYCVVCGSTRARTI